MRARIDTVRGPQWREIRGPDDARRALDDLFRYNLEIVGSLPPLYGAGVRYRREDRRKGWEDWQGADRTLELRTGDCEDLASWRAAELAACGADPEARPEIFRVRPGLMHVRVARGDGVPEDPSAMLGMKTRGNRIRYRFGRRRADGMIGAEISAPIAGEHVAARSYGRTRAEACAGALDRLSDALVEVGAYDYLVTPEVGAELDPFVVQGFEPFVVQGEPFESGGTEETVNTALDATTAAVAAVAPWGTVAATILSGLRKVWGWLQAGSHDPMAYMMRWVSENKDPKTRLPFPGKTTKDAQQANMAALLANGWVMIYCSDSQGTVQNIIREFGTRGWTFTHRTDDYWLDKLHTRRITHYIAIGRASEAPQAVKDAAAAQAQRLGPEESLKRTMKFLTGAKGYMKTYGGTENYDEMIVDALVVVPRPAASVDAPAANASLEQGQAAPKAPAAGGAKPPAAPAAPASSTGLPFERPRAAPQGRADAEPPPLPPDVARRLGRLRGILSLAEDGRLAELGKLARQGGAVGKFIREVLS